VAPGSERGLVFDVQRYSLHDGSGIRTLVFLKGCPLRCHWCSNPEGQSCAPQLAYDASRCIGRVACGDACQQVCEARAVAASEDGKVAVDLELCTACGWCIDVCPPRALELLGDTVAVDEILEKVERDGLFFARSGGGLTLSGGEPLLQADFSVRLLEEAARRGIDTAVETSGCVPWKDLERACAYLGQIFFDVKSLDEARHREATGIGNERILENLRRLCEVFPELPVVVRTPVVPGFNDDPRDIQAICDFLLELPRRVRYELLPYHRFGELKYRKLGQEYALAELEPPSAEAMEGLHRIVREAGLEG